MALQTSVKSIDVVLKSGVSDATLPNNIRMTGSVHYTISLEDYAKITGAARDNIITSSPNTLNTIVPVWNGTNYALNLTTISNIPEWDATSTWTTLNELVWHKNRIYQHLSGDNSIGEAPTNFPLIWEALEYDATPGVVVQGFNGDAFQLVRSATGTATISAGTPVAWGGIDEVFGDNANSDYLTTAGGMKNRVVTSDRSDLTDQGQTPVFAGVSIASLTAGDGIAGGNNYSFLGWIQIAGTTVSSITDTTGGTTPTVIAGDAVALSENIDGQFIAVNNEIQRIDWGNFGAGNSLKMSYGGVEAANTLTFTTLDAGLTPAARAAIVTTHLEQISALKGNVSVTESTENLIYDVEFVNDLANTNVGLLSTSVSTGFSEKTDAGYTLGVITTRVGAGAYGVVGTAVAVAAGVADIEIRNTTTTNRHIKRAKLFFDK